MNIHSNMLLRGCSHCNYSMHIPLPELSKKVIYLDQFFLSHAFRSNLDQFVKATNKIAELAHGQLIVCPYSPIHRTETLQWRHSQKEKLLEFIKKTSRGHEFYREYKIKRTQIVRSFKRYLEKDQSNLELNMRDALPNDYNSWDDYFWIDVTGFPEDTESIRKSKEASVAELVQLFQGWRAQNTTFAQDQRHEMMDGARIYLKQYIEMAKRLAIDDFTAILDSPINAIIVESLLNYDSDNMSIQERVNRIIDFFNSKYYIEVPGEFISSGLFAALRQTVKNGYYRNEEKAKKKLSGIFYDISFISTYAPYCDAMFIDNPMLDLVNAKELNIEKGYNTVFFARKKLDQFIDYLEEINNHKSPDIEWGLKLVHG